MSRGGLAGCGQGGRSGPVSACHKADTRSGRATPAVHFGFDDQNDPPAHEWRALTARSLRSLIYAAESLASFGQNFLAYRACDKAGTSQSALFGGGINIREQSRVQRQIGLHRSSAIEQGGDVHQNLVGLNLFSHQTIKGGGTGREKPLPALCSAHSTVRARFLGGLCRGCVRPGGQQCREGRRGRVRR